MTTTRTSQAQYSKLGTNTTARFCYVPMQWPAERRKYF